MINSVKTANLELKRRNHEFEGKLNDSKKQFELEKKLLREDLTLQKEAN